MGEICDISGILAETGRVCGLLHLLDLALLSPTRLVLSLLYNIDDHAMAMPMPIRIPPPEIQTILEIL